MTEQELNNRRIREYEEGVDEWILCVTFGVPADEVSVMLDRFEELGGPNNAMHCGHETTYVRAFGYLHEGDSCPIDGKPKTIADFFMETLSESVVEQINRSVVLPSLLPSPIPDSYGSIDDLNKEWGND